MRLLVQRVSRASVRVAGATVAEIGPGLLILVGVAADEAEGEAGWLAGKAFGLRIFEDDVGRMNRSVEEVGGEILVVPQFTLYGDARKGRRPSWAHAAPPDPARDRVEAFAAALEALGARVSRGAFQEHMEVELVNDGPVTLLLESPGGVTEAAGSIWPMYLEAFSDNPYATNCWLLAREGSDEALVVDPGFDGASVLRLLEAAGKRPVAVVATHGHYDHVGSAAAVCGTELPLYIHKDDEPALSDPAGWGAGFPQPVARPAEVRTISDGDLLEVAGLELEVLHTPGHTPGSVCFRAEGMVFSGDLVFRGTVGRSDFPNSDPAAMELSLRRFLLLPDELAVYPGHLQPTTVGHERATNPFLAPLA